MHHSPHPHHSSSTKPHKPSWRTSPPKPKTKKMLLSSSDRTYDLCNSTSTVFDLVVKSYSRLNLIDKALSIIHLAQAHGFMPGVLSYKSALDAMIRSKRNISFAENVFKEMLETQVSPNVFTYNILIRGYCSADNLDAALQFFGRMEKKGCLPNVVTYNTLIDGYCKLHRIDDGFELLRSMALKMDFFRTEEVKN